MVPKMPGGGLRVTGLPMKKAVKEPQVYANEPHNMNMDLDDEDLDDEGNPLYDEDDPEADLGDTGLSDPDDGGAANEEMHIMPSSRDIGGFMGGIPDVLIG